MMTARLLSGKNRLIAAMTVVFFGSPLTATAHEIFTISSTNVSGTVEYTASGDLEPTRWTFADGTGAIWTQADKIRSPMLTQWIGSGSLTIAEMFYGGTDDTTQATGNLIDFVGSDVGTTNTPVSSWTASALPHTHLIPVIGPFGSALLITLMGLAGIRKLRA